MGAMMQMFQQMKGGGGGGMAWGGKSGGGGKGGSGGGGKGGNWREHRPPRSEKDRSTTVWIGNIPEGITQDEIAENFKQAGAIKKTNLTKGRTGIVEYSTPDEAAQAITMFSGADINGSILHVDVWTKKSVMNAW